MAEMLWLSTLTHSTSSKILLSTLWRGRRISLKLCWLKRFSNYQILLAQKFLKSVRYGAINNSCFLTYHKSHFSLKRQKFQIYWQELLGNLSMLHFYNNSYWINFRMIENNPKFLETDGLYRINGNAATIQTYRSEGMMYEILKSNENWILQIQYWKRWLF